MILDALNTARDLGRLNDIAAVLVRHGLGEAVRRLGIARVLERTGRAVHWKAVEGLSREPQVRVREAFEQLGPTFVKLGQILAGRSDLLSPAWTEELARLQEDAAPVAYEKIRAQLVEDLGREPEELFKDFDREPLASASIAQIHRASLQDGTRVVLKIRRPGIREVAEADLRLLTRLAEKAEESMPELKRFRPKHLVRQFARSLRDELDLRVEARNAERLSASLAENERIVVPAIHGEWTSERLCVMDYLEGPSLGEWIRAGRPDGVDAADVAALGAEAMLRTILVHGCFHADPHPGNVILLEGGRLGLIDFGMVGYLSESRRREFLALIGAIVAHDVDQAVDTLIGWSDGEVEIDLLAQDCASFMDRYHGQPLGEIDAGALLADLSAMLRENDLFLPSDVAMLLKVFLTLDSLGLELDPGFVLATHLEPFAELAWREQHSPISAVRRGAKDVGAMLSGLPRDLRSLLLQVRRGRIHIEVDVERLDRFGQRLEKSANRVTVGLVTAALIVGTAISLTVSGGPLVLGLPVFGFVGFASSLLAGVWLLLSLLRSGRG